MQDIGEIINGTNGDDVLSGAGNDTILGGNGEDTITASENGFASGGDGDDVITLIGGEASGGEGDDEFTIEYAGENDPASVYLGGDAFFFRDEMDITMSGGPGEDVFEITAPEITGDLEDPFAPDPDTQEPSVTITDFDPDEDVIVIRDFAFDEVTLIDTGDGNTDLLVTRDDGTGFKVLLEGVTPTDIPDTTLQTVPA
ncbi:MAG: hypothetical protein AAFY25_02125 [Pseudomonadota bacterium]